MFSLQTIFGKGDKFYSLLEQLAEAALNSSRALTSLLGVGGKTGSLADFKLARQQEKEISARISQELVNTFVTVLEREDIEELASALYKIPKVVEKFAERYTMTQGRLGDIDFGSRAQMLEKACEVVATMVKQLRNGIRLEEMKALNDKLQAIENEADRLILELYRELVVSETDPVRLILRKDMFEILEKAIDRCRDAGNVVYAIVLKNS
ncbi:pit accessory protein [Ahniella affigens]|uniref:Pit accessory protein n=1 Tax=Ahniella affigens TaxID=2021234 RepID=A0A2P1PMB1_9GAMM|nr:DUF47 family protein [Ahniella affigens]AVP95975.1 pit accessory protein [Ahniella affigens]